jgi:hypothetical protein
MLMGRYRFHAEFIDPAMPSAFMGVDFRGAFGPALKRVVCALKHADCADCLLHRRCLYPHVFEGVLRKNRRAHRSDRDGPSFPVGRMPGRPLMIVARPDRERRTGAPHPCVIEPPEDAPARIRPRETFVCSLLLFGRANESIPYFIQAFEQMGRMGLGRPVEGRRARFRLIGVRADDRVLYAGEGQPILDEPVAQDLRKRLLYDLATAPSPASGRLTVRLRTPLKLTSVDPDDASLPFPVLIRETLGRIASLCHAFGNGAPALDGPRLMETASSVRTLSGTLRPFDSSPAAPRQGREMMRGARTGEATYVGPLAVFIPLLRFVEQVHLGEETLFGLGRIELVPPV